MYTLRLSANLWHKSKLQKLNLKNIQFEKIDVLTIKKVIEQRTVVYGYHGKVTDVRIVFDSIVQVYLCGNKKQLIEFYIISEDGRIETNLTAKEQSLN